MNIDLIKIDVMDGRLEELVKLFLYETEGSNGSELKSNINYIKYCLSRRKYSAYVVPDGNRNHKAYTILDRKPSYKLSRLDRPIEIPYTFVHPRHRKKGISRSMIGSLIKIFTMDYKEAEDKSKVPNCAYAIVDSRNLDILSVFKDLSFIERYREFRGNQQFIFMRKSLVYR